MQRGFIYSSSGPRGGNQPQRGGTGSSNPTRQHASPRKRQRSPSSSVTNLPGPSRKRQNTSQEEEGDDFELDELGSAALELYELTQQERSSPIPEPKSPFRVTSTSTAMYTVPHSTPSLPPAGTCSSTNTHSTNPLTDRNQKWPNPYQSATGLQPSEASITHHQPGSSTARAAKSHNQEYSNPLQVTSSNGENKELADKIRELQERNFTKDGEVKVLRSEKERLLGELRKREEQLHDVTARMQLEKQTREQQLMKESESLTTQLKFNEQELKALQEKCAFLEQKQKASTHQSNQLTSPLPQSRPPQKATSSFSGSDKKGRVQGPGHGRSVEFLSTETFMPLSQTVRSNVTAVHIGQKRVSQSEQGSEDSTALKMKSARSSSVSPTTEAATKKHGKGPSSTPVEISSSLKQSSGSRSTPARRITVLKKDTQTPPVMTKTLHPKDPPIVLDIPSTQLDGARLLSLLVDPNLLKVPEFTSEDSTPEGELSSIQLPVHEEYSTSELSPVIKDPPRKLIGLLSLLHPPVQTALFPGVFPNVLTTPVSSLKSSEAQSSSSVSSSYRQIPMFESSLETTPRTPVRKPKIPLPKPHTCARSDLSKVKTREAFGASKSLSATNTPVRLLLPDQQSVSSLASSINTAGLEQSIASLLHSMDSSRLLAVVRSVGCLSLSGASPSPFGLHHSQSGGSCTLLLQHLGDIVVEYYNEQQAKARASASGGNTSELGDTLDSSVNSPKSSLSSSTISSRDLASPPAADQELVSQTLGLLETLVSYSKSAREQLLAQPPEFTIDSRPSSAMDLHTFVLNNGSSEDDCVGITEEERSDTRREELPQASVVSGIHRSARGSVQTLQLSEATSCEWKGIHLVRKGGLSSGKVWVPQNQDIQKTLQDQPTPAHKVLRGCGQLFSTLLELTAPPWKESVENTITCLTILSALAEDCPEEQLERFSTLLLEDNLGVCLDREDAQLTLTTLHLLTHLARSTTIVSMLCGQGDPCTLDTCYQYFMDPPPGSTHLIHSIHTQLCRLIASIMSVSNGPQILFESTACRCSHELLKSVVLLLNQLLDDVHQLEQLSQQDRSLVCELLSLLHKVSVFDRYFDSHREDCRNTYAFVLNTLSWLLNDTPLERELPLVNDLLEYCEELEDSQDDDSAAGEDENMDEH